MHKTLLVTGGCGFIGSTFVRRALAHGCKVVNLDNLSYAGNPANVAECTADPGYTFCQGDVGDAPLVARLLRTYAVQAVVHFAAESHVDNSIAGPEIFVRTNVLGTYTLLQEALRYWNESRCWADFRFLHISTDEVFGDLPLDKPDIRFDEDSPYKPSSPYSATKAGSDHLARAWYRTYGLPVIVTNCSNNFGPRQHTEKLIPTVIRTALSGQPIPLYGRGENVRDWIHVDDHCAGVMRALERGRPGGTYCLGGGAERTNKTIVQRICSILDDLRPGPAPYAQQITFVRDRPGHDLRYAIDDSLARTELGHTTPVPFEDRLRETVEWYLAHEHRLAS
jgi:dTDP-glucose 4,6-dehydratase